jgi:hypothetical protein
MYEVNRYTYIGTLAPITHGVVVLPLTVEHPGPVGIPNPNSLDQTLC